MVLDAFRLFLLLGLVVHKGVWEVLKRRDHFHSMPRPRSTPALVVIKLAKITMLAGLCVQTVVPEVLPILSEPMTLRLWGGLIFATGLALAVTARFQLGREWSDIESSSVGADHKIIEYGVYRFIRHPIYTGDVLLIAGLELALNSWLVLGVIPLALAVFFKAKSEEKQLAHRLAGYHEYQSRTKRFLPFVI
jgi:protein-S-isoprenylcysteine O-methyltransferase Ste14